MEAKTWQETVLEPTCGGELDIQGIIAVEHRKQAKATWDAAMADRDAAVKEVNYQRYPNAA